MGGFREVLGAETRGSASIGDWAGAEVGFLHQVQGFSCVRVGSTEVGRLRSFLGFIIDPQGARSWGGGVQDMHKDKPDCWL